MAATDIGEREKMVKELAKTRASIRKKHRALKTGKMENEIAMESRFKPIVDPLRRIAERAERDEIERDEIKREMIKRDAIDASPVTTSVEEKWNEEKWKEEELTPAWKKPKVKRIRARRRLDVVSTPPNVHPIERDPFARGETEEEMFEPENLESSSTFKTPVKPTSRISQDYEMPHGRLGPLGRKYLGALLGGEAPNEIDHVYGVYMSAKGAMLGNRRFNIDADDSILIDEIKYIGTPGLYELIFMKNPDSLIYTEKDKLTYKSILLTTNAHKRDHDPKKSVLGNKGYKYKFVIAPLIHGSSAKKMGAGRVPSTMRVTNDRIDYIHWDDPNELVDRLRLLDASRRAGNNAHENEILSIIEELRETGAIV